MAVNASVSVGTFATITQTAVGNYTGRAGIAHDRKMPDVTKVFARSYTGTTSLNVTALTRRPLSIWKAP